MTLHFQKPQIEKADSDTDSDTEPNMDKTHDESSEYESYESGNESDKSYDYLSNCEDEVIELRKRISQRKHTVPDDQDGEQGSDEHDACVLDVKFVTTAQTIYVMTHTKDIAIHS